MKYRLVFVGSLLVLALALLGLALYIQSTQSRKQELTCTISCSQKDFKQGDEIVITFTIKNKGKSTFPESEAWYERIPYLRYRFAREVPSYELCLEVRQEDGASCIDPRMSLPWFMPNAWWDIVKPGGSTRPTVTLNELALISQPGIYRVVGSLVSYTKEGRETEPLCRSEPIELVVGPRTDEQMGRYIEKWVAQFNEAKDNTEKAHAIGKLIWTRDKRIVPTLVDWAYSIEGWSYSAYLAFMSLPLDNGTKDGILAVAKERGLIWSTFYALRRFGCTEEEFKEPIGISLARRDPSCAEAGAKAAQDYPDDSHMSRLIGLATGTGEPTRTYAITAIALNRTDQSVAALKGLLKDQEKYVRDHSVWAIKEAYRLFHACNQPCEEENDFEVVGIARDPNNPRRWESMNELVWSLCESDFALIKRIVGDAPNDVGVDGTSEAVRTIIKLLRDSDVDVRDFITTAIRFGRRGYPGRPLREDDFPELFREIIEKREARKKRVLEEPNSE